MPKLLSLDDIADMHMQVRIGGGGLPFSSVTAPWLDQRQETMYPPGIHGRKRADPRSGGFDVPRRDVDNSASRTESGAGWPNAPSDALEGPSSDLGRRLNIEQMELRAQLPAVEIVPFPQLTKTVIAPTANYTAQIIIPDTAQLLRLKSTAPSFAGRFRFSMPVSNGETVDTYIDPIVLPECSWLYCYGMKNLYVGLIAVGDAVSAMFYMTQ